MCKGDCIYKSVMYDPPTDSMVQPDDFLSSQTVH